METLKHTDLSSRAWPLDFALFPRDVLEALTEALISHLDTLDGDPDLEGEWSEDELSSVPFGMKLDGGPGCPIADAGGQCDEDGINTGSGIYNALFYHGAGPGCEISDSAEPSLEGTRRFPCMVVNHCEANGYLPSI